MPIQRTIHQPNHAHPVSIRPLNPQITIRGNWQDGRFRWRLPRESSVARLALPAIANECCSTRHRLRPPPRQGIEPANVERRISGRCDCRLVWRRKGDLGTRIERGDSQVVDQQLSDPLQ
jgi:hypothetical protein